MPNTEAAGETERTKRSASETPTSYAEHSLTEQLAYRLSQDPLPHGHCLDRHRANTSTTDRRTDALAVYYQRLNQHHGVGVGILTRSGRAAMRRRYDRSIHALAARWLAKAPMH